ncbi:MAG: putative glycosyltransferase ypjH [Candidatus Dadabacteria bacterium CSP1-2]|nr:MAG: putative glycosyltransferase ypjH [Candidatus Dadabacteria bacterium CSP1-2]
MKIGIAGPMTLRLLNCNFRNANEIPIGYDFPMISMLINALLKRGHEVVAYTTSAGIGHSIVYRGENLIICIARRRERYAARDLFKSERKDLVELMRSCPVDIINAQWSYEFAWAALDSGIPTLVTLHDYALTILKYQFDGYRFMRLITNYIVLKEAQYLSANSQYLFNLLSKKNKRKTRVIPNFYARNLEEYCSKPEEKSNFIISVSNGFGRRKNISTALRAFSIIRLKKPDVEYHLVGDSMEIGGPAYQYAIKNKVTDGVRFIGRLSYEELINKVKKALVFLHPSREESFGMSVLEAMVVGTPVVGGYCSGNIPYLLDNGRLGVLCNIDSPEEIAKGVLKILSDDYFAISLVGNARKFSRDKFSEDIVVKAYINYYRDILDISQ